MFENIGILELMILVFSILLIGIFWVIALIDIMKNNLHSMNRLRWIIVVIAFPIVGAILYFIYGKNKKSISAQA
jgi:hypothetical protein